MNRLRYPGGEEIHAGDTIVFQGQAARVLFLPQGDGVREFASGVSSSDWEFIPATTIFLEFRDGRQVGYDGFCKHDGIVLVSRERPPN